MKIAFDGSSILWTCLLVGEDVEGTKVEHGGKTFHVNSANYGYENVVNHILGNMRNAGCTPKDVIFVWEGMNSKSPRLAINSTYKQGRGDRPPEAYAEFQTLKDRLQSTFFKLGSLSLTNDECEGDDTLTYLAQNTEEDLAIVTGDNDLAALNGVNKYGANITVVIKGNPAENKYGDFPCNYITVYKALVGDRSDGISGIKGFGLSAFELFYKEFGLAGLEEMDRLAKRGSLDELVPEMDQNKMIKRLVEGRAQFLNSYELARLRPEWVNTLHNPLVFQPGLCKGSTGDARLKEWEGHSYLVTADKWDSFKSWALPLLIGSDFVALDIETSTPDQSDEWLEAQGKAEGVGVDVIGSELTGMSLTFGANLEKTVYIPVDHADTDNVDKELLRDFIKSLSDVGVELAIHNYSFEGTVLYNEWGTVWKDNGNEGLVPNCLDTKIEASYVDENNSLGLKKLSKLWFNYDQTEYSVVTTIAQVQYKMRELTGEHVKDYGCDDTICTAAFHSFAKFFMQLEHTWEIYKAVEIDAMYLHTQSFIHGVKCDISKSRELEAIDAQTSADAWAILSDYLVQQGWSGTVCPSYSAESSPAQIKEAFQIITGKELSTKVRLIAKMAAEIAQQGSKLLAELLLAGDFEAINKLVQSNFKGKPEFNTGSPKQLQTLMYETMALPIRVHNKPTAIMRKAGIAGSPKTDALAVAYALQMDATDEQKLILDALRLIKMVETRNSLYYSKYPYFVHWKTGRIHSSHNQSATNTRRASSSAPNVQQLPKHPKIEGQAARFREAIIPHKLRAVIVSMDFMAQELRIIGDYSRDQNMLDCFIGDNLKDMHALTGLGIAVENRPDVEWSYPMFVDILEDKSSPLHKFVKECRVLGKKTNFTTEFGAMAPKLAQTLLITEAAYEVRAALTIDRSLPIDSTRRTLPWLSSLTASIRHFLLLVYRTLQDPCR